MASSREDFNYWLVDMDDALDRFMATLPDEVRQKLDYSPESLEVIEQWLLERYPSLDAARTSGDSKVFDGVARYVGETFRRNVGGRWSITFDDPKDVNYGLPALTGFKGENSALTPLTLATASTDRRTGKYLRGILDNIVRRAAAL
jgi:hypothetical protein